MESGDRFADWIAAFDPRSGLIPEFHPRSTLPAGVGLGMKAAVQRILVFRKTCRAHGKPRHRRARPVIRNIANNSEARSAVGAIDERIAIAPVIRVEQFAQAVRTYRNIRRNQRMDFLSLVAMNNAEVLIAITRYLVDGQARDPRQRWSFGGQVLNEILNGFR